MSRPVKVEDWKILAVLSDTSDIENVRAMTTGAVERRIELGRQQTQNRLNDLVASGYVGRRKYRDTTVWWITEAGLDYLEETRED